MYPSRLKDEPRQGFLSVQLFERERPLFGYCFSSGDEGLFCDTIFPKKPLCPIARKRRAMTGFIRVPFFKKKAIVIVCFMTCHDGVLRYLKLLPSGAKRHLSKSCRYRNRKFILRLLAYNFLMSGRESVFNSQHHNRMANHHRADPRMVHEYARACAEKMFEGCECVIATHTDTQTVHSHIVVNAVHPLTGKKLHFNDDEYAGLKDMANEIGEEFGFSSLDFRKKAENKRTNDERHIILKGGTSWKEELREVIEEGKLLASDESEFFAHLAKYGVKVTRSGKDYSYLHPEKSKAIRGQKLGDNYTKREVLSVIEKHGNRTGGYAVGTVAEDQRDTEGGNGKRTFERSVGDLKREMQRINQQAEYAHRGLDYERERDKERQQLLREKAERERAERSQRDTRDNAGRAKIQSGSKSNYKERDWSNSR